MSTRWYFQSLAGFKFFALSFRQIIHPFSERGQNPKVGISGFRYYSPVVLGLMSKNKLSFFNLWSAFLLAFGKFWHTSLMLYQKTTKIFFSDYFPQLQVKFLWLILINFSKGVNCISNEFSLTPLQMLLHPNFIY